MATHEHRYEFTHDPEVLEAVAAELDWPDEAHEQINEVQRCPECGDLNRLGWTGQEGAGMPRWMISRLREHKAEHE